MKRAPLGEALVAARLARKSAYAPYSGYRVGAALMTREGGVYSGCNVENATYGATLCAERAAIAAMIAAGAREPIACVVVTEGPTPAPPCGICRQVLAEFAPDMAIVMVAEDDAGKVVRRSTVRLRALFPHAFRLHRARTGPAARASR